MSGADMFEDGFPHSTIDGYRRGCKGSACPGVLDNGFSCSRAFQRYNGDVQFRRLVDEGKTPAEIYQAGAELAAASELAEKEAKRKAAAAARDEAREPSETVESKISKARPKPKPVPVAKPKPVVTPEQMAVLLERAKDIPAEKHGKTSGYWLGCRLRDACPSKVAGGESCNDAVATYQRQRKAGMKAGTWEGRGAVSEPAVVEVPSDRCTSHLRGLQCSQEAGHEGVHGGGEGLHAWMWVDSASDEHSTADVFDEPIPFEVVEGVVLPGADDQISVTVQRMPDGAVEIRLHIPRAAA